MIMMRSASWTVVALVAVFLPAWAAVGDDSQFRKLPVDEYVSKMKASWIGQMAAVGWGQRSPRWQTQIMPLDIVPKWEPRIVNQFFQDDIYLDVTFLSTLERYGLDVSVRQAGIDFANTGYNLWHANLNARENLRNGIAPPDSGHPQFNKHPDDIDYQIQADYAGLISPGLPNAMIRLGEKFGSIMNYGDGIYGGQFIGGMLSEAFFESDPETIVRAGLRCIPEGSQYHKAISDVLRWHEEYPDDWQRTWMLIDEKYRQQAEHRRATCFALGKGDIDAKLNGSFVALGLLYGGRDIDNTIVTTMRCGQDSDCTSSTVASVLFATMGYEAIPDRFKSALNEEMVFSHSDFTFPRLIDVCEQLARKIVLREGGRIEIDENGEEIFAIPVRAPQPSALVQSWEPGPVANSRYTDGELRLIVPPVTGMTDIRDAVERFAPGWNVRDNGSYRNPGFHATLLGKKNVLATHPLNNEIPCILSKRINVPSGGETALHLTVGHDHVGDWQLIVRADGDELLNTNVGHELAPDNWMELDVDLTPYAGRAIELELLNAFNEKNWEAAFWADISIRSSASARYGQSKSAGPTLNPFVHKSDAKDE
jgi:hypothetical protein